MKLREIVEFVQPNIDLLEFKTSWVFDDNGDICPHFDATFDLDTEVEVIYYWYHHMNPHIDTNEVNHIIMNHDFKQFWEISERIEEMSPHMCYFPVTACVVTNDEYIGDLNIFRDEKLFSCITYSECECG